MFSKSGPSSFPPEFFLEYRTPETRMLSETEKIQIIELYGEPESNSTFRNVFFPPTHRILGQKNDTSDHNFTLVTSKFAKMGF